MVIDSRGSRKRPTFDSTLNYLQYGQESIKYPDRSATFLRDSHQMGFLDNFVRAHLQEQELDMAKEDIKQAAIRQNALYYVHKKARARTGQGHDDPFYPEAGQGAVQQPAQTDDQQAEYFSGEENEEENK